MKVDLHVLDNGGNIADCASIAAITALAHFRYASLQNSNTSWKQNSPMLFFCSFITKNSYFL